MEREHTYGVVVRWTGNRGSGTSGYTAYGRDHEIEREGKLPIHGSSDPAFRGAADRWNPEELLVASLCACHQLWYLHLCSAAGVVVTAYEDLAEGTLRETRGEGRFIAVVLRPRVTVSPQSDVGRALALHEEAHAKCFIANSVNFPVTFEANVAISVG